MTERKQMQVCASFADSVSCMAGSNTEAMQLRVDLCLNKAACYKRLRRHADDVRSIVRECSEALEASGSV